MKKIFLCCCQKEKKRHLQQPIIRLYWTDATERTAITYSTRFLSKFNYNYAITLLRILAPMILKIKIKNYKLKEQSMVDFYIYINHKNISLVVFFFFKSILFYFEQLMNITCIDNLTKLNNTENKQRFTVVYLLNCINTTSRMLICYNIDINTILVSLTSIFKAANWLEREIFDMFGLYFVNHSDLRRILTDYGFKGFPLRKDFPLTGYIELRFKESLKTLSYNKLNFIQEVRFFNFILGNNVCVNYESI